MTDKEKILAEIQKRVEFQKICIKTDYRLNGRAEEEIIFEYQKLINIINSLPNESISEKKCNITGIKSKHATGKLKECIDNQTEEGLEQARKQLEENPQECIYARDNYTDEDRKVLCNGCEEECEFNKKEYSVNNGLDLGCGVIWKDEEPVSDELEEAAQEYTEKGSKCQEELDAFKAGAKWQKLKEAKLIINAKEDGYRLGLATMKQLIMAEAVKVKISNLSIISLPRDCGLKVGDKLLVIKEDKI